MSKSEEEEEEEEEERESEDRFYESLDRILSSSNSSTSNSDDEDTAGGRFSRRSINRHGKPANKSPLSAAAQNYDVWTSTESFSLSSIEQRRDRFLLSLGLPSDSSLTRQRSSTSSDYGRSNATHQRKSSSTSSILSICSVPHTVNSNGGNNKYDCNTSSSNGVGVVDNLVSNGLSGSVSGSNKHPTIAMEKGVVNGVKKVDRVCRIKNLDNGKEFVVNEVREDGMWDKLKEVGTGRQLTMEEFEICVGHSPIVQELMRRQNVEDQRNNNIDDSNKNNGDDHNPNGVSRNGNVENGSKSKKKVSWFRSIKNVASSVAGYKERRSSNERDSSSDKGGRRSSSATDDSQDASFHGPERVRVRQYGKSVKELSALYKSQEIKAHNGSIWSIKFSLDGRYLASAGEDCVIHVWQIVESEKKGDMLTDRPNDGSLNLLFLTNGSPEPNSFSLSLENPLEKRKKGRTSISRKSISLDHIMVPETVFGLSEKPICSFQGHSDDVLDLSWSKSQLLLSSSMDKTVRLWNLASNTCLKIFSHNDYVTCIQFNPVDDRYFISGSLDGKVRIWSIPDHQVVDWNDLHEMVTAACYTPDGLGALVGSYKGSCRQYNTSENKLQQKCHIDLQNRKKKSHLKKITGFQFVPGSSSEVVITSADSRIRVVDGVDLVHKFKGFRNTNSQISASLTANGKYVVCASEDSHVYIWKHEADSQPNRSKSIKDTRTYEHFHCQNVSIAIPWPGIRPVSWDPPEHPFSSKPEGISTANHPPTPVEEEFVGNDSSASSSGCRNSPFRSSTISSAPKGYFDRISVTWPEENLLLPSKKNQTPRPSFDFSNGVLQRRSAWGMVIVTAGIRGEIRTFQNFGFPVRI